MKQLSETGAGPGDGTDRAPRLDDATRFDRTTHPRPRPDQPGVFDLDLDDGWSSLTGVHGGYLAAIAARGTAETVAERAVRTITTNFLSPARPGPAELTVATVRHGRTVTVATADLHQNERAIATTRITLVAARGGADWSTSTPPPIPAPDRCVPIEPPGHIGHFDQATAVLDPAHLPFAGGERPLVQGHVRPLGSRPIDAPWLAMVVDWFPPAAFSRVDPPVGGTSIDLTTHIHRTLPAADSDQWLAASFECATSLDGLALERGWVADANGALLAESFHTRWTA